jgi:hypothetical protein
MPVSAYAIKQGWMGFGVGSLDCAPTRQLLRRRRLWILELAQLLRRGRRVLVRHPVVGNLLLGTFPLYLVHLIMQVL